MKHELKLNPEERVKAWLALCDFTLRLMSATLDKGRLEQRLGKIREEHLKSREAFLANLGKVAL